MPAPQGLDVCPYLPAPQAVHDASAVCPVAFPYLPKLQAVQAVAPVELENFPAPQSVQGADPVNALYFPATHAVQLNGGPDEPTLQMQVTGNHQYP
jgi:hypothetical protein